MNLNKALRKIKGVRIQGARDIAIVGLKVYVKNPTQKTIKKLIGVRPTEPCLVNALEFARKFGVEKALKHFELARERIAKFGVKKINGIVFTHCHSSTVVDILKMAKKEKKKFQVFNTETRPLYQGRKTSYELAKAGIKVTVVVDAAAGDVLDKGPVLEGANLMLIGCDAILKQGIINKIGSGMFAEIAYHNKVPVYIATDSWKFSPKPVKIEFRNYKEVWKVHDHIKVLNPAFEVVDKKYITAIISELGILKPDEFIKKIKKSYPWIIKK